MSKPSKVTAMSGYLRRLASRLHPALQAGLVSGTVLSTGDLLVHSEAASAILVRPDRLEEDWEIRIRGICSRWPLVHVWVSVTPAGGATTASGVESEDAVKPCSQHADGLGTHDDTCHPHMRARHHARTQTPVPAECLNVLSDKGEVTQGESHEGLNSLRGYRSISPAMSK